MGVKPGGGGGDPAGERQRRWLRWHVANITWSAGGGGAEGGSARGTAVTQSSTDNGFLGTLQFM